MGEYVFKLPDLGEGTVQAEIGEWHVKPGDPVTEDQPLVDMMTDKAAVEIPSPVTGRVVSIHGEAGDLVAVGTELIVFETTGAGEAVPAPEAAEPTETDAGATPPPVQAAAPKAAPIAAAPPAATPPRAAGKRPVTSPAIRQRARKEGIDLTLVQGTGPRGRITREDLEAYIEGRQPAAPPQPVSRARTGTEEVKVIGVRRVIARRMSEAKRDIPHFAYVEEIDVTELEALRRHLNGKLSEGQAPLTYLPFLSLALVKVLEDFPQINALFDEERGVIVRHHGVHIGIATQTDDGLKVPVLRHAEALSVWEIAEEVLRLSTAARDGTARKEELTGSTITITSLGKLGGLVSTPIINAPELAIIAVNKAIDRPVIHQGAVTVRRMMNLSSSFDHRYVDGFDAAAMIQALKEVLEHPATLFV